MPELPEVETVVRTLRPRVAGRHVVTCDIHRPDFASPCGFDWTTLAGRRVDDVTRRGKRIVFVLDAYDRFFAHLGMTGRLLFDDGTGAALPHTHATFTFPGGRLRCVDPRRFGGLVWGDAGVDALGPEPLDLTPQGLMNQLHRTRRAVKVALLDQRVVAGVGNIYADEALFAAGVHPGRRGCDLTLHDVRRITTSLKRVLTKAIDAGGSTLRDYVDADGHAGSAQTLHRVYGREMLPCTRCRTPVTRVVLGGRSTHFCARCQQDIVRSAAA